MPAPEPIDPSPAGHPTQLQRSILWTALTALAVLALVGVAGLVFFGFVAFLSWCYPILLPIGLAVLMALVLEPLVSFLQKRRRMKRENAALSACLLAVIAFVIFWAFLSGPLIDSGAKFFQNLPDYFSTGLEKLNQAMTPGPTAAPLLELQPKETAPAPAPEPGANAPLAVSPAPTLTKNLEKPVETDADLVRHGPTAFQEWLKTNLPSIEQTMQKNVANFLYSALGPVGQAFGFLLGFGFVPIYVYYFLADEERIAKNWHEFVPLRRSPLRDEVVSVLAEISQSLVSYFRGQIIVAACNGVLTFIGLTIIGVPYSLVLGIITGALSIVPFLGIICSIIPAMLLAFLAANDPKQWLWLRYTGLTNGTLQWVLPLLVLAVFALVQMSESMFITPRVQSHSTGLHPLAIIIGILFWSMLLPGLLGPIVAVPLTCALVVLLRRYVWLENAKPAPAKAPQA
ncbi:MAG TPA: AI-2E family transporter [Candidatus Methylacidiphilales bacterium]|jgi:predicted PurR-regulated permease PerM|nr:AI-2E family transporter [Candidatus Methylacidiphilales bacterium]